MSSEIAQFFIILILTVLNLTGNLCSPGVSNLSGETAVRESQKESIPCILKAASGADLPQSEYFNSPLPSEPYYAGTTSIASYSQLTTIGVKYYWLERLS